MKVKAIRLLELPNLTERGDIIDWIAADAGNTKEKFLQLVEAARPWTAIWSAAERRTTDRECGSAAIGRPDLQGHPRSSG